MRGANYVVGVECVDMRRLDKFIPEILKYTNKPRIYLKIDTQGYDVNVIKGADGCINDILGFQSELSVTRIYDDTPDYIDALMYYRNIGYELSGIYPITRDNDTLLLIEFDCFLIRRDINFPIGKSA